MAMARHQLSAPGAGFNVAIGIFGGHTPGAVHTFPAVLLSNGAVATTNLTRMPASIRP